MPDDLKDSLLSIFEASLDAQLRAVRRLRRPAPISPRPRPAGLSQVDMAFDILKRARAPLHVAEILARIQATFHVTVDRESLVSSLSKKVARRDRFLRTAKNTFALRPEVL
jgi:HB1, ASXL, restriction endonuclease HTH domain